MAAFELPDESLFTDVREKAKSFDSLKKGTTYLVTGTKSMMSAKGRRKHVLTIQSQDSRAPVTVWAPYDFATKLREKGVNSKFAYFLRYNGSEQKECVKEDGTYTQHLYLLAQTAAQVSAGVVAPSDALPAKAKPKAKSKARDDGEESEA